MHHTISSLPLPFPLQFTARGGLKEGVVFPLVLLLLEGNKPTFRRASHHAILRHHIWSLLDCCTNSWCVRFISSVWLVNWLLMFFDLFRVRRSVRIYFCNVHSDGVQVQVYTIRCRNSALRLVHCAHGNEGGDSFGFSIIIIWLKNISFSIMFFGRKPLTSSAEIAPVLLGRTAKIASGAFLVLFVGPGYQQKCL